MSKQETPTPRYKVQRTRRTYTLQFKAQLVAACLQPGASVAALAREHDMNANVLHRWRREHERRLNLAASEAGVVDSLPEQPSANVVLAVPSVLAVPTDRISAQSNTGIVRSAPGFVPVNLRVPAAVAQSSMASDIRIECCHHGTQVTVHWPVAAAAECRHWLQSLLRGAPT